MRTASPGATTTPGSAPTTGARCCAIPRRCPRTSARFLRRRTPTPTRFSRPTRALQRQLAREMRARLKEDDSEVPPVGRPLRLLFALPPGRPAAHLLPPAARRRQGDGRSSTATSAPTASRSFASQPRAIRPITQKFAWSADDKGSEMYAIRVRDVAADADLPDRVENAAGEAGVDARFQRLSLCRAERKPSPLAGDAASPRRASERGRDRLRGGRSRLVHRDHADAGSA